MPMSAEECRAHAETCERFRRSRTPMSVDRVRDDGLNCAEASPATRERRKHPVAER